VVVLAAAAAATDVGRQVGSSAAPPPSPVTPITSVLEIDVAQRSVVRLKFRVKQPPSRATLRRLVAANLPDAIIVSRGRASIRYRYDIDATVRHAIALGRAGGHVQAVRIPVSSRILAPVVRQFERNACEAAALSVLLASTGTDVSQQRLQAGFPRSGPLDPAGTGPDRVWGNPDAGYVGRPEGGGAAGGFGIYPGPVAATARRYGRRLEDLTASSPQRIYGRLLRGRAVMAWIGLSDGPYDAWRSPAGKRIQVNFGEHTIVLTGIASNGDLQVVNPLRGTFESWSKPRFEAAWQLLGRRALSTRE